MKNNNIEDKFYNAKTTFNSYSPADNSEAAKLLEKIYQTKIQIGRLQNLMLQKHEALKDLDEEAHDAYEQVREAMQHKDKVMLASAAINYKDVLEKIKRQKEGKSV